MNSQKPVVEEELDVKAGSTRLKGNLVIPNGAKGIVMFAHGSGSSRFSPRNRFVANGLNEASLGTLLFDLLTPAEEEVDERTRQMRFDINLLAERLIQVIDWAHDEPWMRNMKLGLFGSSTGAAGALVAASERPKAVVTVVSRGGRPDLAGHALPKVQCPVLLIVGGEDWPVVDMNRDASRLLHTDNRIEIIAGATHLFQEPGALEKVTQIAKQWFVEQFSAIKAGMHY